MPRIPKSTLAGIGLMLLAMLLFPLMDAVARWLVRAGIPAIQVIAVRGWLMIVSILLFFAIRGELGVLKPGRPVLHIGRGALAFLAPYCFFVALKTLPLADATVMFFSSTFILTGLSALLLKESVGVHRWSAVVIGFTGVVVAMDPGGGGDLWAYLLVLMSSLMYAFIFLSGSYLSKTDSVMSLVFSLNLMMGLVATLLLPWAWVPIEAPVVAVFLLFSALALAAHISLTMAFSRAQVSALAPFEYTSLIWAAVFGYLVWGDVPALKMWIGAAIIIASGLYLVHRESVRRVERAGTEGGYR